MRLSSVGFTQQSPEGEKRCLNSEIWHACAGLLVSLLAIGSRVVYFPQGHSEQDPPSKSSNFNSLLKCRSLPSSSRLKFVVSSSIKTEGEYCRKRLRRQANCSPAAGR
ncbi:auxin response factor 6-like [Diospyros lotus]|uniref:auxin response factor 6-like n=1 Tax=Diospyros lotus TaxID=55363 RepID=UPI00225984A0|nr:auxin response factor 6-like [Diospyros lotus]